MTESVLIDAGFFICPSCDFVTLKVKAIQLHLRNCTNSKHKLLQDHTKVEKFNLSKTNCCQLCNKDCQTISSLDCHYLADHLKFQFNCTLCKNNFKTFEKFWAHRKSVHGDSYVKCPLCDQKFNKISNLKRHLIAIHIKIKRACNICKSMVTPRWFKEHMKLHSMTDEEKKMSRVQWNCDNCDKSFKSRSGLRYHSTKTCTRRLKAI